MIKRGNAFRNRRTCVLYFLVLQQRHNYKISVWTLKYNTIFHKRWKVIPIIVIKTTRERSTSWPLLDNPQYSTKFSQLCREGNWRTILSTLLILLTESSRPNPVPLTKSSPSINQSQTPGGSGWRCHHLWSPCHCHRQSDVSVDIDEVLFH